MQKYACSPTPKNLAYWHLTRERVELLNKDAGHRIRCVLGSSKPLEDSLLIATCGSDGRLEKGLLSKLEIIIYHSTLEKDIINDVCRILSDLKDDNFRSIINNKIIEVKNIETDNMSYAFQDLRRTFPARVLDSFALYGNNNLILEAKFRLAEECSREEGKKIQENLRNKKRDAKSIMTSGKQMWKGNALTHYDLDSGIAYFDDVATQNNGILQIRSFKAGPLRFVQNTIEHDIITLVRKIYPSESQVESAMLSLLKDLPTPTITKLGYLADRVPHIAKLDKNGIADVIDCYLAFLQLYHTSESISKSGQKQMSFDIKEVKERIDALARLLNGGIFRIS